MKEKRKCKFCGKEFVATKDVHRFCSRQCFKKDYYRRKKQENMDKKHGFPVFVCEVCGRSHELEFDPITDPVKYDMLICPYCGTPRNEEYELYADMLVQSIIND